MLSSGVVSRFFSLVATAGKNLLCKNGCHQTFSSRKSWISSWGSQALPVWELIKAKQHHLNN